MADELSSGGRNRRWPYAHISRSRRSERAAGHPQSRRTQQPARGTPAGGACASKNRLRLVCVDRPGMGQSSPQKARTYAGWADDLITIADALGYHEFGVTGWSEGGPWALAAAAYIDPVRLRHVSSIAPGSYGAFGDNWAAEYLSKIDALGGTLALRFTPGFRLMYATLGITAKHFRSELRQTSAETVSTSTTDRFCFDPRSEPPSATHAQNASPTVPTDWSATLNSSTGVGLSMCRRSSGQSTCGKDSTISSCRIRSTRRWPTRCPDRYGIRSRAPAISSLSAQGTTSSPSRPRNWAHLEQVVAPLAGRPGDRPADPGDRGRGAGRQRAGAARRPRRRRRGRAPAGRRHRHRAGRLTVDGRGDRIRKGHRDSAAGHRGRPHEHRHRVHHDHGARPDPVHPHRSGPDRRQVHRHHRARAARRDVHRGVHRHAGPVDPRHRAGARRLRPDRRPGVGGHHSADAWPTAGARSGRRSPRSALRRWRFRWSGCGRSGAGCCGRPTGCVPTSCG